MASLEELVRRKTQWGWRVETSGPGHVVMVKGKRVSHLLHLFLGLLTCAFWWVFVWLPLLLFGGEKRITLAADPSGGAFVVRTFLDQLRIGIVVIVGVLWIVGMSMAAGSRKAEGPAGQSVPAAATASVIPAKPASKPKKKSSADRPRTNRYAHDAWQALSPDKRQANAATLSWEEVDSIPSSQMLPEEMARWSALSASRRGKGR